MSAAGGAAGSGEGGGTPAAGAGGTPPAAPAAGGAPPPPPAVPPPRAAAGGKGGKPPGKAGGKSAPFDKHPGFRKRVDQEALRVLRRELGVDSLDEAKALLGGRAAAGDGGAPPPPAAAAGQPPAPNANQPPASPPRGETPREKKLREDNEALRERVARQHKQILKTRDTKRADVTALEMKFQAVQAGIAERYVNFALAEFRELYMQYQAKPGSVAPAIKAAFDADPVNDRAVFAHVLAQNPMIGTGAALPPVVVPLDPSTAPPASRQPGEDVPPPKPPGAGGETAFDATKLSDKDWREYKRRNGMNF